MLYLTKLTKGSQDSKVVRLRLSKPLTLMVTKGVSTSSTGQYAVIV